MKASPSSAMSVIWIDIWDSQKGSKGKTLINCSFNFGRHTATVRGLLCILGLPSIATAGAGDIQPMHVMLKVLSARNMVGHTEWKTTDLWLGAARLIPSPTLPEKLL